MCMIVLAIIPAYICNRHSQCMYVYVRVHACSLQYLVAHMYYSNTLSFILPPIVYYILILWSSMYIHS